MDIERSVQDLIDATREEGSPNVLPAGEAIPDFTELWETQKEELSRFPKRKGKPFWDLIAADWDSGFDAQFIIVLADETAVRVWAGRGPGPLIRSFSESEFPDDPLRVPDELDSRFGPLSGPAVFDRQEFEQVIGVNLRDAP